MCECCKHTHSYTLVMLSCSKSSTSKSRQLKMLIVCFFAYGCGLCCLLLAAELRMLRVLRILPFEIHKPPLQNSLCCLFFVLSFFYYEFFSIFSSWASNLNFSGCCIVVVGLLLIFVFFLLRVLHFWRLSRNAQWIFKKIREVQMKMDFIRI